MELCNVKFFNCSKIYWMIKKFQNCVSKKKKKLSNCFKCVNTCGISSKTCDNFSKDRKSTWRTRFILILSVVLGVTARALHLSTCFCEYVHKYVYIYIYMQCIPQLVFYTYVLSKYVMRACKMRVDTYNIVENHKQKIQIRVSISKKAQRERKKNKICTAIGESWDRAPLHFPR